MRCKALLFGPAGSTRSDLRSSCAVAGRGCHSWLRALLGLVELAGAQQQQQLPCSDGFHFACSPICRRPRDGGAGAR